jgi:ligand-binding SRPBCC domain-containing protein
MTRIELSTRIDAPIERCFDLARSIDLHMVSTEHTGERAIGGRTRGLIDLGESVTWRAKHFGTWQTLTSKIVEFDDPHSFTDVMVKGAFKSFRHEHRFYALGDHTEMKDVFTFESPFGIVGKLVDALFLRRYLTRFLERRNSVIKETAEHDHQAALNRKDLQ